MLAWRKDGLTFPEIATWLNAEAVPTRSKGAAKWHPTQVQRVLRRNQGERRALPRKSN